MALVNSPLASLPKDRRPPACALSAARTLGRGRGVLFCCRNKINITSCDDVRIITTNQHRTPKNQAHNKMMMMNYTTKTRPRRAFGERPPAPRKPKGKLGRPFVGARGGGPRGEDSPCVHSPRVEGPGRVKVTGQARPPEEGGSGRERPRPRVRVSCRGGGGRLG